jgi:hypothetical protein
MTGGQRSAEDSDENIEDISVKCLNLDTFVDEDGESRFIRLTIGSARLNRNASFSIRMDERFAHRKSFTNFAETIENISHRY